jgi:predicted NUDIX family NTP pyrophosphohydrolase
MATKGNLIHSIISTLKRSRAGSYGTRFHRKQRLTMVANELLGRGYKLQHIRELKLKHVHFLVEKWKVEGKSAGTIKNRMTDLRVIMEFVGKPSLVPKSNDYFNIPKRQYVTNEDKSRGISAGDLSKITDENLKISLLLQKAFGLRRCESIKIRINQALFGDELRLKGSWCKNGKPRMIKIQTSEQWEALDKAQVFVGEGQRALIPDNKQYKAQLIVYQNQTQAAGLNKLHGLRHAYAQNRYRALTGWDCPAKGGPTRSQFTVEQKALDKSARLILSVMLGHERLSVVAIYCGV